MKYKYDLHIHSGLSPCADNDMTPVNIIGVAKLNGLDIVAICDHNAIANVEVAIKAGKEYGILVVPAMELQTLEEIHILCLFETYEKLKEFYNELELIEVKNRADIFGEQLIYDEDDNVTGIEERLLLMSMKITSTHVRERVEKYGGIAVPAHIDRDANSMLTVLGCIEEMYNTVELSLKATSADIAKYSEKYKVIVDSDAHTLADIGSSSEIELKELTVAELLRFLR